MKKYVFPILLIILGEILLILTMYFAINIIDALFVGAIELITTGIVLSICKAVK